MRRDWHEGTYDVHQGLYRFRTYTIDPLTGKRQRKEIAARDKKELKRKVAEWIGAVDAGQVKRIKMRDWCSIWLNDVVANSLKPATKRNYDMTARLHLVKQWGDAYLDKITPLMIQKYFTTLSKKMRPKTCETIRAHMRVCFEAAVNFGYLVKNPVMQTRFKTTSKTTRRALTEDEAAQLIETARKGNYLDKPRDDAERYLRHVYYMIIRLGLALGARKGELFALKWEKFNPKKRIINIDSSLTEAGEKGLNFTSTKNGKSRTIIVSAKLSHELYRWHQYQNAFSKKYTGIYNNKHGLIITNSLGNPLSLTNFSKRVFKPLLAAAGITDRDVVFHSLRHTNATILANASASGEGVDIKTISERLGHADAKTTMIYLHSLAPAQAAAAEAIERHLIKGGNKDEKNDEN